MHLHLCLLVGYAPQSGLPDEDRRQWWQLFGQLADQCPADEQLYVLLDANADPGPYDGPLPVPCIFVLSLKIMHSAFQPLVQPIWVAIARGSVRMASMNTALTILQFLLVHCRIAPSLGFFMTLTWAMAYMTILQRLFNWIGVL